MIYRTTDRLTISRRNTYREMLTADGLDLHRGKTSCIYTAALITESHNVIVNIPNMVGVNRCNRRYDDLARNVFE